MSVAAVWRRVRSTASAVSPWCRCAATWALPLVCLVGYVVALSWAWPDEPVATRTSAARAEEDPDDEADILLTIPFGYGRRPLTRSVQVDLCTFPGTNADPDCAPAVEGAPRTRSAILDVALTSDPESGRGRQFPASQLAITTENAGQSSLAISVAADPSAPERIDWGNYEGTINIDRTSTDVSVRLVLQLTNKADLTALVLLVLAGGGAAGVAVKWVGQSLPTVAAVRRRHRRLVARLRKVRGHLPDDVSERLAEMTVDFQGIDVPAVASEISLIESHLGELRSIGHLAMAFDAARARQEGIAAALAADGRSGSSADDDPIIGLVATPSARSEASALIEDLLAIERPYLDRVLSAPWLWAPPDQRLSPDSLAQNVEAALEVCRSAELLAEHPDSGTRLERLRHATFHAMSVLDREPEPSDPPVWREGDPRPRAPRATTGGRSRAATTGRPSPRTPIEFVADHARLLAFAVTLAVTVGLGYWSQFETQQAFVGDLRDIVGLALWAFAVQVSGVTVLETIGAILPGGATGAAGALDSVSTQIYVGSPTPSPASAPGTADVVAGSPTGPK